MHRSTVKRRPLIAVAMFATVAAIVMSEWLSAGAASLYGAAVFAILGTKLFLSILPARTWGEPRPHTRVGVVVTVHNEDPALLRRCLESILAQTHQPTRIVVVDDHSEQLDAYDIARRYAADDARVTVVRQPQNLGKRQALGVGFRAMADDVDVFMCVDSDSTYEPTAIYEGIRPFRSRRVKAVTGMVVPLNHDASLLTRLQDVRYVNSFVGERAAYSQLGAVLCVCGAIAFWRADVVMRHLDAFLDQTFLGQTATVGDDRHLTNLCLVEGKVVLAPRSIGHTAVPEKLSHYVRQQARWGRSFFRESMWALRHHSPTRAPWWLTLLELGQWVVLSTLLTYVVLVHPILTGELLIGEYLLMIGGMALARSVRYFDLRRAGQRARSRAATFATAPLYGYVALFVLLPLRTWSLLTIRATGWGTRAGVEVTGAAAVEPHDMLIPEVSR